jgi:hypothetical protein
MSAWHSFATQAALDSLAEQPTESLLMCDSKHARMRPSPGAMPAHRDLRSTTQNHKMIAMLESGLDVRKVITHRLPASRFLEGFDTMGRGDCGKIVLDWRT